jgi:hypothetical protein
MLATLPERSVQTCITSPPYFGLRDYGTGEWDGGDPACDHTRQSVVSRASSGLGVKDGRGPYGDQFAATQGGTIAYASVCGKCGARRVDRQIGLEPTPDEFVAALVDVFRAVRRVLRDDGTVFLNLGDSYASSAVSVQRVRRDGIDPGSREGDVSPVLSPDGAPEMDRRESGAGAGQNRCVSRGEQGTGERSDDRAPSSYTRGDCEETRGAVPVLRGDDAGVPDDRPRSERRGGSTEAETASGLQDDPGRGLPTGPLSDSLLELQLGERDSRRLPSFGDLKPKDLIGIPWMVAFALRADGWYLRSDIIWSKPNPMPESVTDRPTKAHEYLFLLSKGPRYFWDADAIREDSADMARERIALEGRPGGPPNGHQASADVAGQASIFDLLGGEAA